MANPYPREQDLRNLHNAMDFNSQGLPVVRTLATAQSSTTDASIDGFGRQRVAQPFTLFDAQLKYTKREDLFDESLTGNASTTYQINESSLDLEVTTTSGDHAVRESKNVFPYQPGKSLQIMATFVMDAGQSGLTQSVGYYNTQNGIFFMNKDGVNYIVRRSYTSGSAVDEEIAQSSWNIDKLDGTTTSGVNIDITKAQILFMDLEWLGVGQVRVGFVIDGNFYTAHVFQHANNLDKVYMTTAVLPVRYEIQNTADTVASSTMKQICSTVISEGGYSPNAPINFVSNGITGENLGAAGSEYPLISIRLNSSRLDAVVVIRKLQMLILSNQNVLFALKRNATITLNGTSWVTHSNGTVDYVLHDVATGGGNLPDTVSGGEEITGGWLSTDSGTADLDGSLTIQLGRFLDGTSDTITVTAIPSSNGVDVSALLGWSELV